MNTEKVTELYGQLSPFLGDKVSKEEFINGMNDPEIRKGVYNEVIKFPGCENITEDDFNSNLGFDKKEQSLWQSIGSNNPYPQVEKQVTSVTGSEVKRPDDYEKDAESSWLNSPFYNISKEELDTQIKQLEDIDNKAMSPVYEAFEKQTGRKYNLNGENAPGDEVIFDNIFQSKKAEELRKRGYYEANSSARRAKIQKEVDEFFEDNSEETKQARTRLSKLRQEKAWRSRQEGGSLSELGKSLQQQKDNLSKMQQDRPTDLSLNGALKYLDDAIKVYNAPSKYGDSYGITNWARGLGDQLVNYDTWTAGATEMARMIHLNNIVDKLNKNEALTDSEQAKLESYMLFNAAQEARMEDISSGYNVGKGSAESIPFMAEMLITAGAGAAAKKALIKYALNTGDKVFARRMARALGEEVAEETIKRNAEKKVVDFATKKAEQGIIEKGARQIASDATMTAFMPTTWTAIAEEAVDKKLRGEEFTFSDALRAFTTQTVETGTERWGGRMIDKAFAKVMPLDKIWGKTRWGKLLTNDFIQSPLGETGEEYLGAAVNYIRSFNPFYSDASNEQLRHDARQMFSVDGLTQTFMTVLPMTMLGGAANVIAHKQTINDYKKAKGDLLTILQDAGATKDEAEEIITKVESADDSRGFTARLEYSMSALKMYYQTQHPNATLDEQKAYFEKLDDAFGRYFQSAFYLNELSGEIKETIDNLDDTQKQAVQQAVDKEIGEQARRIGNQPFKVNSQKKNIVVKDKRNKDTNATVYYSADNLVLKDDGTIDETQSENLVIKDYKGNEIKGKQREEWLDALNVTLANEQAVAQKEKDLRQKQLDAAEEVKKNEDAIKKAQQDYINETVKDVVLKNGVIDTKSPKTTKQQIFVWNLLHQGQEEAIKRASEAVGESLYALDKLEEDTTTPSEERYSAIDVANANIKAYEEAVRNSIGEQSAQKLRQDAEGYVAILMQRDMENAQEEERKHLARMAERQRIRQENRKKAGINLDNPESNSNIAQNPESNDNTGGQQTNEGGASTSLPESTEGGLGEDRGNSGADNGATDGSSNTDGVRSGITAVDSLDNPNGLEEGQEQQGEERKEQNEEQEEEQGEGTQQQEPVDLTAPDVVLMTSGAGTTRQTFVFAKKVTDESGNVAYISLGNPYNKSVPTFGKVLRSNWGELDKSKKMFYVNDIDGNPIACYAFTKEDLSTKKFKPGAQLNAVVASSGEMITAATSMPAAYVIGKNGEEVSILKGENNQDKRIRVESVKALLDYPIVIRYKSEAKGQDEIVFTLRDLLYSGKYKGDSHIISKDDEKKTVKRAHSHPYSVALEYLREESRKAFGADVAGAYTSEFNTQLRHLFEAWNAYCKEIGLTDISDKLNKLTQSDRDLFWSARAFVGGSNLDEADKASLTVSTDVDAKQMSEYLRANPLHQLAVMLYIGSKVAPQYVSGAEFAMLPGKSAETGKGRVKNVQPMVTKDVIEKVRERYKALKAGKVSFNADSYVSDADEITNLERYYPEVLTDEPVHNRPRITEDNEKKVKQDIHNNKLQEEASKKAAKEAAKTDEEREADQYDILEKTIEDGFSKIEAALAEKNDEKVQEYIAQLNLLISGNEAAQQRLQDMLAEAMAQEVEHPVPVESAAPVVEEQPAAQEPEVTSEEPAAEPIPQAEEEVPAPEKRRKRNKKETPADQLRTMLDNVRDLKRRMDLGDREVTPSSIQEATDAIMDFISENGDTEELWNMYNAEFSVSPEQIATTERSRTIGNILVRMIGRIKGPKVRVLNTQEDVERKRAELRRGQNGDTVEDLQTPEGIIYGFAIGDEIYITPEGLNADTPIHEFTHLWVKTLRANDRKLWKKIVKELKQNKALWEAVTKDENYKHLTSDDAIASEVLARFCGKKGAELLEQLAKGQKFGSEKLEKAFINRAKRSVRTFWQWVAEKLFGWAGYKAKYSEETIDDFADMVLRDLFDGKALLTETERNAKEDERIQKEMADIKEKAIKEGTFMKAPNGQPSNLPERLWLLVRTENFKDWFGDWENDPLNASKVVDENGEPLVVYHGTNAAGFDRFRLDKDADARSGSQGFYNTDNRRVAAGYTRKAWNELPADAQEAILGADPHEAIYSLFANIRNPWRINFADEDGNKRHWNEYPSGKWAVMGNEELGIEEGLFNSEEEANEYLSQFGGNEKPFQVMLTTDDFLRRASSAGFDGCIFTGVYDGNYTIGEDMTDYVALLPTQLKSVHNRGYFSTIDDRIEYANTTAKLNEHDDVASKANEKSKIDNAFHEAITNPAEGLQVSKFVSEYMDMMEGMRVLQDNLAVYLRMTEGVENLPAKYDIRNMFESKDAIAMNAIRKFNATLAMELNEAVIEVQDAISKTAFYEEHKKEVGGEHPAKLTPIEFVGRYLIARNDYERAKEGTARGMEEFYERMGMTMEEFWRGFHENVDEALILNLWDKIKQVTNFELDVALEGQLITQEEHDRLMKKDFYVPQRGFWDEVNPENKDEELVVRRENGKAKIQLSSMQKARGGKSLAENPLVYIYRDANEAIIKSENNKVKVALYNMLLEQREWCSSPEVGIDAPASISYRMVEGVSEPQKLIDGYTEDEIKQIRQIQKHIDSVKAQLGTATGERETVLLNLLSDLNEQLAAMENGKIASEFAEEDIRKIYNHKNQNEKRNTIGVLINGIQHEIVMPEKFALTAQAFNGKRNTDGLLGSIRTATSFLAAQFTVNNPTFWAVNFTRDVLFVELKGGVEYGPMFNAYFTHYLYYGQGALNRYLRKGYVEESSDGEMDNLMREFIEQGGNTGLFNDLDLEKFRYNVRHLDPKAKTKGQKALGVAADVYQWATLQPIANYMNELSELTSRFAAFCAIKRMGYDTNEAVKASHNLSVNFNRRGLGNTFLNIFSSITPFVNATIQGTSGFWRTFGGKYGATSEEKRKKILKAGCVMAGLPMLLGCLNAILVPDDPDDVDGNISEWDRMNNICFPNGIRIPLLQEIRPFWAIGVNIGLLIRNQRTLGEFANSMFKSVLMNGLPIPQNISEAGTLLVDDVMGGEYHNIGQIGETLIQPSFMGTLGQIAENRNFLGGKLRFDFKDYPEYEMAPNESAFYRTLSETVYRIAGGDTKTPSKHRNTDLNSWWSKMSPLTDVNPKQWKSYLFFVPSGVLDFYATITGGILAGIDAAQGDYDAHKNYLRMKDVFIANKFLRPSNKDGNRYEVKKEVKAFIDEFDNVQSNAKESAYRFGATGEQGRMEASAERFANVTNDYLAIVTRMKDDYALLQNISRQALKNQLHLNNDAELNSIVGIEAYNTLDDAEKAIVTRLNHDLRCLKDMRSNPQRLEDINVIDTTGVVWRQGRGTSIDGKELVRDVDGNVYVKENDQLRKVNVRR